ncbi:MAG TPA: ABATE domain-containing protein [Polyangiaceae bacterium]|nr:ABATE domain-containing protein [Polyangiaceae bacterium]
MNDAQTYQFDLCGGHLALDFANTVSNRHTDEPTERLARWDDVVSFAEQTSLISRAAGRRLRAWGQEDPRRGERLRKEVVELREALYAIFAAVAEERRPAPEDLTVLNAWLRELKLGAALDWEWGEGPDAPTAFVAPILRAAVDLATGRERARVRMCEASDCVWLFLDASKNRSRRWCDMNQCGNREKARRFHERAKGER